MTCAHLLHRPPPLAHAGVGAWHRSPGHRGSVTPFVAVLAVATGGLCIGLGRLGGDAVAAARARTAADAAALAGAAEGEEAARALATGNGGELVEFVAEGAEVQVRARVGRFEAVARAARTGGAPPAGAVPGAAGLTAEMQAALARAAELLGGPVPVTSGWRSPAAQRALYANRAANPFPVARPGTSAHERGEAIDVPRSLAPRLAAVGPAVGLCRPLPRTDPVHFELCRRRRV